MILRRSQTIHRPDLMEAKVAPAQIPEQPLPQLSRSAPGEPTMAEMAVNFAGAVAEWSLRGFPVVTEEEYAARAAICDSCDFWDPQARLGLGKCKAPGCGCTKLKRWLRTEKCVKGKWPVLMQPPTAAPAG